MPSRTPPCAAVELDTYDHDAQLVVLRDLDGAIFEGPGFNIFANVDGRWLTPAVGTLEGITRRSVIEPTSETGQPPQQGRLAVRAGGFLAIGAACAVSASCPRARAQHGR